jgi:alpha-beta hydrolase superfamily lysophospholipase
MITPLAKFIDWLFIQKWCLRMPPIDGRTVRLEEALQFLKGPDFIPAESQPARLEFSPDQAGLHFRFPTPRPGRFAENNVVNGRLYRCAGRWQERPAIILLHGGNMMRGGHDSVGYRLRQPLTAHGCNRARFNAATLELPYHFQRYPRQPGALNNLDYLRLAAAAAQAVAEIRALTGWLLAEGCPTVALWGTSMGGRLAGLTVCHDARPAAAVMAAPGVRSNRSFAEQILRRRVREVVQRLSVADEKLDITSLNLTTIQPAIPKENILLIESIHDLLTPKETIEDLWQAWGHPDIWRLPHGHISKSLMPGLTGRVLRWLTPRLDKPAGQDRPNDATQSDSAPNGRQPSRSEVNRT